MELCRCRGDESHCHKHLPVAGAAIAACPGASVSHALDRHGTACRAGRAARRRRCDLQLSAWSSRQRHSCGVSSGTHQHHVHFAQPCRRAGFGGRHGQRRAWSCRLRLRVHGAAFFCRSTRFGGWTDARARHLRRLESGCTARAPPWRRGLGAAAHVNAFGWPAPQARNDCFHRGGGISRGRAQRTFHRIADRLAPDGRRRRDDHPCTRASARIHRAERNWQSHCKRRLCVFALSYAALAQNNSLRVSLSGAFLVWLGAVFLLRLVDWSATGAVLLNAVVYPLAIIAARRFRIAGAVKRVELSGDDLAWRAGVVTFCVLVVTGASSSIGSYFSGVFAFFPVAMGSFFIILHPRIGGPAAASVAAHVLTPLIGLGLSLLAVHLLAGPLGVCWSYAIGLSIGFGWNALLWGLRQRR